MILYLGKQCRVLDFLQTSTRSEVVHYDGPWSSVPPGDYSMLVSFGYRYIIPTSVFPMFDQMLNLHISFLPWNRGADPNFWSFIDNTIKGVTIHRIDAGIDTGPILLRKTFKFSGEMSLRTTYERLQDEIQNLFIENWKALKAGTIKPMKQDPASGSVHYKNEFETVKHLLPRGFETKVKHLGGLREAIYHQRSRVKLDQQTGLPRFDPAI